MNKFLASGAVVVLVLGLVSLWVLRSAQETYALMNEPYTPFTDLRMLAANPTATPDRHDLNVGRYRLSAATPQTPDRHDLNVGRYRLSAATPQTPDRHDRNVMRYRLTNAGAK